MHIYAYDCPSTSKVGQLFFFFDEMFLRLSFCAFACTCARACTARACTARTCTARTCTCACPRAARFADAARPLGAFSACAACFAARFGALRFGFTSSRATAFMRTCRPSLPRFSPCPCPCSCSRPATGTCRRAAAWFACFRRGAPRGASSRCASCDRGRGDASFAMGDTDRCRCHRGLGCRGRHGCSQATMVTRRFTPTATLGRESFAAEPCPTQLTAMKGGQPAAERGAVLCGCGWIASRAALALSGCHRG